MVWNVPRLADESTMHPGDLKFIAKPKTEGARRNTTHAARFRDPALLRRAQCCECILGRKLHAAGLNYDKLESFAEVVWGASPRTQRGSVRFRPGACQSRCNAVHRFPDCIRAVCNVRLVLCAYTG